MYFHTLFHPYIFPKNIYNATRITLPNAPQSLATKVLWTQRKQNREWFPKWKMKKKRWPN